MIKPTQVNHYYLSAKQLQYSEFHDTDGSNQNQSNPNIWGYSYPDCLYWVLRVAEFILKRPQLATEATFSSNA